MPKTQAARSTKAVNAIPSVLLQLHRPDPGNCPSSVETRLTRRQGAALKALYGGLYMNAECEVYNSKGKQPVGDFANTVRWLLDRVADEYEKCEGHELESLFNHRGELT
ncbi:MAG: hypothetical protein AAGJ46_14390 [Planctomycetota bacterium]